jgi:hypothetical protein
MKGTNNKSILAVLLALAFVVAACNTIPGDTEPVAAQDVPTVVATEVIEPTPPPPVEEPAATATEPVERVVEETPVPDNGMQSYANADYGFSLCYPNTWSVAEVNDADFAGPGSRSIQLSQGTTTLVIGYRLSGEEAMIMGTGGPAGELEAGSSITILGQDVTRHMVTLDGQVQAVFYGQPGSVLSAGSLEFAPRLDDFSQGNIDLTPEVQEEADLLLSSLTIDADGAACSQ